MGLWDKIKGEFIDIIDWTDSSNDTITVSYTHLDVYKRQLMVLCAAKASMMAFINSVAVSYTHLDVYKRQVLQR